MVVESVSLVVESVSLVVEAGVLVVETELVVETGFVRLVSDANKMKDTSRKFHKPIRFKS